MIAILSVKPKYVEQILKGNKRYEFRKSKFRKDVEEVLIYATKPVMKVVGKFRVGKIIEDTPEKLWNDFGNVSGLTKDEFFEYFKKNNKGVAIEIIDLQEFSEPLDLNYFVAKSTYPQSWIYLSREKLNNKKEVQIKQKLYINLKYT